MKIPHGLRNNIWMILNLIEKVTFAPLKTGCYVTENHQEFYPES